MIRIRTMRVPIRGSALVICLCLVILFLGFRGSPLTITAMAPPEGVVYGTVTEWGKTRLTQGKDVWEFILQTGIPYLAIRPENGPTLPQASRSLVAEGLYLLTNVRFDTPGNLLSSQISTLQFMDQTGGEEVAEQPTVMPSVAPPVSPPADVDDEPPFIDDKSEIDRTPGSGQPDQPAAVPPSTSPPLFEKPLVLIYHTHTTEAYKQTEGCRYQEIASGKTTEFDKTVVAVGEQLKQELEKGYGIRTLHDTTYYDTSYFNAYTRSGKGVSEILLNNPSVKVVIDLHRDAPPKGVSLRDRYLVKLNGKDVARIRIVVGNGRNLPNPNWQENKAFAEKLAASLEKAAPGLLYDIQIKNDRYNQHLSPQAVLLEIGSSDNTLEEAKAAMPYLAKALAPFATAK